MNYIVYKITNSLNGKFYVGMHKTENLEDGYMGSSLILKKSINKHGIQNFEKEILFIFDNEKEMIEKEIDIVNEEFVDNSKTYNVTKGGGCGFYYINKNNLNNKKSQYRISSDKLKDPEYRRWFSKRVSDGLKNSGFEFKTFLNKKHSEETKRKIGEKNSIKQKGYKNSQYGTCWMYNIELKKNRKIKIDEIENWISKGWIKGRKVNF